MDKKYESIRKQLKGHIKNNVNSYWTWNKKKDEFTCLYGINPKGRIYTAKQLLDEINLELSHLA